MKRRNIYLFFDSKNFLCTIFHPNMKSNTLMFWAEISPFKVLKMGKIRQNEIGWADISNSVFFANAKYTHQRCELTWNRVQFEISWIWFNCIDDINVHLVSLNKIEFRMKKKKSEWLRKAMRNANGRRKGINNDRQWVRVSEIEKGTSLVKMLILFQVAL